MANSGESESGGELLEKPPGWRDFKLAGRL